MKTNILYTLIGVTVAIIVTASLLVPALDDNNLKTKEDKENTATLFYNESEGANISVALGDSFAVTIDGEPITINHYDPIAITDSFMLVRDDGNGINICSPIENKFILGNTTDTTFTLTMASGAYTATLGDQTFSGTYTKAYVRTAENGDYIQQNTASVNPGVGGIAYIGAATWGANEGIATISDFTTGTVTYSLKTYVDFQVTTSTDTALTWEAHDNGDGSYDLSNFASNSIEPIVVLFPAEYYTYEDNAYTGILSAIVPLVIVAILLSAIGIVISRRND